MKRTTKIIALLITLTSLPAYGQRADDDLIISREVILLRLARTSANAGWHDKAITHYRKYLSAAPHDHVAHGELAGLLLETGQKDASITEYQKLVRLQPKEVAWLLFLADTALTESDPGERPPDRSLRIAHDALQQALTLEDNCETRKKLAKVLSWTAKYQEVLLVLRPCRRLELEEAELCRAFAEAIYFTSEHTEGEIKSAARLADQAIELSRPNTKLLAALARAMVRLEESEKAVQLFEKVLEQQPQDQKIRFELANLLHNLERYVEAEKHYTILLDAHSQISQDKKSPRLRQ